MDTPRNPHVPALKREFTKAVTEPKRVANDAKTEIVTKKEIEALENSVKLASQHPALTPKGMKRSSPPDPETAARIARMKERLKQPEGKAREDFGKSAGM